MPFDKLPENIATKRSALYLSSDSQNKLLTFLNSVDEQTAATFKSHSDIFKYLLDNTSTNYKRKYELQQVQFADYLYALQEFARKVSSDINRETEGLFIGKLSTDDIAAAMLDYCKEETPENSPFPTENFVEKLLSK
jgi:hypothetical protein